LSRLLSVIERLEPSMVERSQAQFGNREARLLYSEEG